MRRFKALSEAGEVLGEFETPSLDAFRPTHFVSRWDRDDVRHDDLVFIPFDRVSDYEPIDGEVRREWGGGSSPAYTQREWEEGTPAQHRIDEGVWTFQGQEIGGLCVRVAQITEQEPSGSMRRGVDWRATLSHQVASVEPERRTTAPWRNLDDYFDAEVRLGRVFMGVKVLSTDPWAGLWLSFLAAWEARGHVESESQGLLHLQLSAEDSIREALRREVLALGGTDPWPLSTW